MIRWLLWCLVSPYVSPEQKVHSNFVSPHYEFGFIASSLVNPGDLVYDVNSGSGNGFKLLGVLVGLNGSIIGVENDFNLFEALKVLAIENNFLDRSLILHSNAGDFLNTVQTLDSEQNVPVTLDDIHITLGGNVCGSLIRISSGVTDEGWLTIYNTLVGSVTLINKCKPILLLENFSTDFDVDFTIYMKIMVIDLLSVRVSTNYDIRWYGSTVSASERVLLAIPVQNMVGDSQRRVSLLDLTTKGVFSFSLSCLTTSDLSCITIRNVPNIRTMRESFMTQFLPNNDNKPMEFPWFNSVTHHKIPRVAANGCCFLWVRQHSDGRSLQQKGSNRWSEHIFDLCTAFTTYRLEFFNRIWTTRSVPSPAASPGRVYAHYENSPDGIVSAFRHRPFEVQPELEVCAEPVWCAHSVDMQLRIRSWQFPDEPNEMQSLKATCANSKFLVFEPPSDMHGIGSLLQVTAAAFRYAVCLDRIFVMSPVGQHATLSKWRHPGCDEQSTFECYFEKLHGCGHVLSRQDVENATNSTDGHGFDRHPTREERVLVLRGLPLAGDCQLCHSFWPARSRFFDGLFVGGVHERQDDRDLLHATAFMSPIKLTYISQFLRFLMRPRVWFADLISDVVQLSMYSPTADEVSGSLPLLLQSSQFPRQYVSLHVRFGMKAAEAALQPLTRYMSVLQRKLPWTRDVFVSTETESVIESLVREYPEYRFHYLRYRRLEYLDLNSTVSGSERSTGKGTDFVSEFVMSMANLYVSSEAGGFVGTLSSNWCTTIHHLERSRGDGGYDYLSVDGGSAFTTCF